MPEAGYCAECRATVWLNPDGSCQSGHPPAAIAWRYDAPAVTPQAPVAPTAVDAGLASTSRPKWPFVVGAAVLGLLLLCGCGCVFWALALAPYSEEASVGGDDYRDEAGELVAIDYPDWEIVTSSLKSYAGTNGSGVSCTYTLIPPGRDFPVSVLYEASDGGALYLHDEVLCEGGRYHDRYRSLLDYIESHYIEKDLDVLVMSSARGDVQVQWTKTSGSASFSFTESQTDELVYDEDDERWSRD